MKAIKAEQYAKAIPLLEGVVSRDAKNADAYNWLAYATRKNGNPTGAIPLYEKAVAIDPKLPKAKERLRTLDSLCFITCSEYRDLMRAVEAYEKSGGKTKPTAASGW